MTCTSVLMERFKTNLLFTCSNCVMRIAALMNACVLYYNWIMCIVIHCMVQLGVKHVEPCVVMSPFDHPTVLAPAVLAPFHHGLYDILK